MNKTNNINIKFKVQRVVALISFVLFAFKMLAYFLTNSVGVLTDALESTVNVTTGLISLYAIYVSIKPIDDNHPFGHGKAEFLSASIEGFLIIIAGLAIIFEAIRRLFLPIDIQRLDIGIIIVAGAGIINYILGYYSIKKGREHNSIALVSSGKHLQSDTYSSIGLVVGLILLYITKVQWLDSMIAIIFGMIILITGAKILKETTSNLMDRADINMIAKFGQIINLNKKKDWIDIHNFKLVKYTDILHINCDLVLPFDLTLSQAHKEGEELREILIENFPQNIVFNLHIDECFQMYCEHCNRENCSKRIEEFKKTLDFDLTIFTKERKEQ